MSAPPTLGQPLAADPPTAAIAAPGVLDRAGKLVGPAISQTLARLGPELRLPAERHLGGGGKRVRAALVLLSAAASGADESVGVDGAVAIELVHNYSLIHDDIIDEDRERRHRPTTWVEFGVGTAIVTGDALATLALQVLLDGAVPERVAAAASLLEATQAMITGQAQDMAFEARPWVSVEECVRMEAAKTGALLSCAASLGAIMAGAPQPTVDALREFGSHLGSAFQAVDDMLGIWGDPSVTGKAVGSDLVRRKKSLPIVTVLQRDDRVAEELRRILSEPADEQGAARAARLLEESGVRADMQALADRQLRDAARALEEVDLRPGPRDELLAVAAYVTSRDR